VNYSFQLSYYLLKQTLTNEDLEKLFPDWKAGDIEAKTGIYKRHCAAYDELATDCVVNIGGTQSTLDLFQSIQKKKKRIGWTILG